ncbi:hypothetical protein HPB51_021966 [Rhipicephalus microplus]|uniref:Uncharacterized protein n=1 Tax=Rhipicephalus microplus TaxID=6941 RepID=A0A9J6EJG8_RHIMP|nr:hypothetical protein HPB51_021966 [Rhipicephalus microplus]
MSVPLGAPSPTQSCGVDIIIDFKYDLREVYDLEERHIVHLFQKIAAGIAWHPRREGMLTHHVYKAPFTYQQINIIKDLILNEIGSKDVTGGDYANQVVLPEFLIKVYMAVNGTSAEESETLMMNTR